MSASTSTMDPREIERRRAAGRKIPGLLLIFSVDKPASTALPIGPDGLELGRSTPGIPVEDKLISRQHARVTYEPSDRTWRVEDLGSRNGTFVDGMAVTSPVTGDLRVVRVGASIFLLVEDLSHYQENPVERVGSHVIGALLKAAWRSIRGAAERPTLHITGETGSGKELAARAFHQAGPCPKGPFVAVNCAAIPEGVAERLLFGARRGAFSGATSDADGYVQAAHGGTLFLDEIGELELPIQAKLLRVLETREVLPLGSTRGVPVEIRLCSATHQDLLGLVSAKKFRADLYYRIGRPHIALPPLRERLDEIPELVVRALHGVEPKLEAHVSLVETCLLRPWPGNVRELLVEVGDAARHVTRDSGGQVLGTHLSPRAGLRLDVPPRSVPDPSRTPGGVTPAPLPSREVIVNALQRHQGRVATTARELGLHRNQLRRWLVSNGVDPKTYEPGD